jgi:carboxymethylenebutenolidase
MKAEQGIAEPLTQLEIDQRVFDLYDEYCHGRIDRRAFLQRAAIVAVGGLAMAQALLPRYAQAQTISFTDERIKANYVTYPSPGGSSGTMRGYLVQPKGNGPFPVVLVIHENRGLNPYIETWHGAPRPRDFWRWRPTDCFRSAAIRATTMTAARCRPALTRASCAPTC